MKTYIKLDEQNTIISAMKAELSQEGYIELLTDIDISALMGKTFIDGVVTSNQSYDEIDALSWRNTELASTDLLVLVPDYPYMENLLAYRQALRDWPSTEDFPNIKPVLAV